ncbi:MAG: WYL domain-containing protein, partial [Anaerolineae bacterium]|nr:WYL domain-containing protein [Anaerolineae bacterium]
SFFFFLGEDAVEVQVWFDEYQARWIREQEWPEHYNIDELEQGELTLTFKTAGLEGVKMWVMKYGSHAEVLAPPELRAEVVDELRGALGRYEEGRR